VTNPGGPASARTVDDVPRRPARRHLEQGAWLAALFLLVVAGRLVFVGFFAESIPYWDEWDAEGARLLKPWLEGNLGMADLFAAHNEHRIALTRLVALLLFELNGQQWDNLVTVQFNVFVYAATTTLLHYVLTRMALPRRDQALLFLVQLLLAWLPFGFTNSLAAFQNQFFLMIAFSAAAVACAAQGRDHLGTLASTVILAAIATVTMASGLLAAIVAGGILCSRIVARELRPATALPAIGLLACIAITAYLATPHIVGHEPLKADSAGTWAKAMLSNMAWPLHGRRLFAAVIWLPGMLAGWQVLRSGLRRSDLFTGLGLAMWTLLQCAAMAYSRGADGGVGYRYLDLLAVGLVANLWLALRLVGAWRPSGVLLRRAGGLLPWGYAGLFIATLVQHAPSDLAEARRKQVQATIQQDNVRRFVRDGDPVHLQQPFMHIPYPDAHRLGVLLSDPTIRHMLPASVAEPLLDVPAASTKDGFRNGGKDACFAVSSCAHGDCGAATGTWRSPAFDVNGFAALAVRFSTGRERTELAMDVTTPGGAPVSSHLPGLSQAVLAPLTGPMELVVIDGNDRSWIAFDPPVGMGPLSVLAQRVQHLVRTAFGVEARTAGQTRLELPSGAPGDSTPRVMRPGGSQATGQLVAPRDGWIEDFSLYVGTYQGKADGFLVVRACNEADECVQGRGPVANALDNAYLDVEFDRALRISSGGLVHFSLQLADASHHLAVLTYPDGPESASTLDPSGDEQVIRTVRIGIGYAD
jgi:hypothetical protein